MLINRLFKEEQADKLDQRLKNWNQRKVSGVNDGENENISGFPSSRYSFASLPHRPVTKTNEPECRRVSRTMQAESIYLHTSTGLVERLWASSSGQFKESAPPDISSSGGLMDVQRQVLFLLTGALDKKPEATPPLKAAASTKHRGETCFHCFTVFILKKNSRYLLHDTTRRISM